MSSGIEAWMPVRQRRADSGWAKGHGGRSVRVAAAAAGFTLIELMITVTIVAILTGIAIMAYRRAEIKNNRSAAEAYLATIAQQEQQYFIDNRSYATTEAALGLTRPANVASFYTITQTANVAGPPPQFTWQAAPLAGTYQTQDSAGTLTINNLGQRTSSSGTAW